MKGLFTCIILCALSTELIGQSFYYQSHDRRWLAIAGSGVTSYFGELVDPGKYFDKKPNFNVGLERKINSKWSARTEFGWYQIDGADSEASDVGRQNRNLSFSSNNFEWNIAVMWGVFREGRRFYQRRIANPYVFGGLGLTLFNPKAVFEGETYALRKYDTEGVDYATLSFVVPAGLGIKIKLHDLWNLNIEGGYRLTFTDYLDDVSGTYIDASAILDPVRAALVDRRGELGLSPAEPGTQRGNPSANDGYAMINIKVEFYLPTDFLFPPKEGQQGPGNRKYRGLSQ